MPTLNGTVVRTYAGRAGLFTATIAPFDGSAIVDVHISDLDGEPERFNERLMMARLFRDAMDAAEPVVVEYQRKDSGQNEVESVRRCTRHHVSPGNSNQDYVGIVARITIREQVQATSIAEHSDVAEVLILDPVSGTEALVQLAFQRAERAVEVAMLDVLQSAHESGEPVTVRTASSTDGSFVPQQWIIAVERARISAQSMKDLESYQGFVEAISSDVLSGIPFAYVQLTTAPPFTGPGNIVDPSYFEPATIYLLVSKRSHLLDLLTQALNEGQRVAVNTLNPQNRKGTEETGERTGVALKMDTDNFRLSSAVHGPELPFAEARLALSVSLLAPLASQARPVWVRVHRESLDRPPEAECGGPVPTSDLSPRHVVSLQVPHRAAWEGVGCFNRGVYRIQAVSPVPVRIVVDGKEKGCVISLPFPAEESTTGEAGGALPPSATENLTRFPDVSIGANAPKLARDKQQLTVYSVYICLEGCHTVRVEVDEWRCNYRFALDVMKIR